MLQMMLVTVSTIMLMMAAYVFRGGGIALDADTNLEGRPAQIVAVVLVVAAVAILGFAFFIMPQMTR
jgi:hypothetical protein